MEIIIVIIHLRFPLSYLLNYCNREKGNKGKRKASKHGRLIWKGEGYLSISNCTRLVRFLFFRVFFFFFSLYGTGCVFLGFGPILITPNRNKIVNGDLLLTMIIFPKNSNTLRNIQTLKLDVLLFIPSTILWWEYLTENASKRKRCASVINSWPNQWKWHHKITHPPFKQ